jgi:hypothetical protein
LRRRRLLLPYSTGATTQPLVWREVGDLLRISRTYDLSTNNILVKPILLVINRNSHSSRPRTVVIQFSNRSTADVALSPIILSIVSVDSSCKITASLVVFVRRHACICRLVAFPVSG